MGDPKGYSVGGKVSFSGVTLAAGYMTKKSIENGDGTSSASDELSFGAKYDFGKNHVGAGYLYGEARGSKANTKEDEADRLMVSYRRDLAKGVQYRLNLIYADFVGEDPGTGSDDNEAIAVTTGIRIAF